MSNTSGEISEELAVKAAAQGDLLTPEEQAEVRVGITKDYTASKSRIIAREDISQEEKTRDLAILRQSYHDQLRFELGIPPFEWPVQNTGGNPNLATF